MVCEHAERTQIAVVVMVVTQQDRRDGRQVLKRGPPAAERAAVSGPARSEYIGSVKMFPEAV